MADGSTIVQIKSLPGIKRDGTRLEGDNYVDGEWVRWQRALPRKMGGYRSINKFLTEISNQLSEYTQDRLTYVHSGSPNILERFYIDGSNNTSVVTNRTPTSGFTPSDDNMWQFTIDSLGSTNYLIAQVAPNMRCICNSDAGEVFAGPLLATTPLVPVALPIGGNATGGVLALHPYTFVFGSNGYVAWSVPGDPTDLTGAGSGDAYVTSQKIVRGLPLRGGPGNAPSGILWSADSLLRVSFVGGDQIFQFDTLSTQTSILGSNTPIEYDGIFYWIGVDRFLMFNGVVREIDNNMNINFFFDNLNSQFRQKVYSFKVPRYGEIWWCFPKGTSTECNHAIIYNVREKTWYDTPLPNNGRSAAIFPTVFSRPLMTGVEPTVLPQEVLIAEDGDTIITEDEEVIVSEASEGLRYKLWVHEIGVDEIDGQMTQPIRSFFETGDIALPVSAQINRALQVLTVEPDFVQSGPLTLQVRGRRNARAPEVNGPIMTIPETAGTPPEEVVMLKEQRRELRFRFESNVLGGNYQMGTCLAHLRPGDGTYLG